MGESMLETMFLRMPLALLVGAAAAAWLRPRLPPAVPRVLAIAAFVAALLVMPFWMLPITMDRAAAFAEHAIARDLSLALTGFLTLLCWQAWAPLWRHLWLIEQIAMLLRYAVWYGLAPAALCTAWDAGEQQAVGLGLLAAAAAVSAVYAAWSFSRVIRSPARR
jgi:hypothetical protein